MIAFAVDLFSSYNLIIEASVIIILSFFFGELARKTNIPSVLMLIILGMTLKVLVDTFSDHQFNFFPILEILGIVGLIMIVLEAALELELKREKLVPISVAFGVALVGLMASTWMAALVLEEFIPGMTTQSAWIYATPLSILSSAIIIPSVTGLKHDKKEFHIYESTFSDILGILLFYFLLGQMDPEHPTGAAGYGLKVLLTIAISLVASYVIVFVFQNIKTHVKLFLLIAVLLLLYAIGKKMHLSSLIIILVFGLLIANMKLFFKGPLGEWLNMEKAKDIYEGLHVVTMETAFVVRTFFFVVFGLTISIASLANFRVFVVSALILLSIYLIRFAILRLAIGKDIIPQLYVAPRGLITILLYYNIPEVAEIEGFNPGILLFIIIATSIIMTIAMVYDKRKNSAAIREANSMSVGYTKWKAPALPTDGNS